MSNAFIGEIRVFAGSFAPTGWALCDGQLLPISNYQALFSLLGTTYGGNGTTTFQLPDLRSRSIVGTGVGANLSNVTLGQTGGTETISQVPAHTHSLNSSSDVTTTDNPADNVLANGSGTPIYNASLPDKTMSSHAIGTTGTSTVPIRNPYLGLNYIIALDGLYPSRP
jgi:microcystin-dependent protein